MVLAHPAGSKWKEREPEEQMEVCPKDATVDLAAGMKHVMVIVPIDADIDEAENIAQKNRQ